MPKLMPKLPSAMPYLFTLLLMIVTYLMLIELPPHQGGWPYWDKVQHIFVFTALALLGFASFTKILVWISAFLIIYGAAIEHLQGALTLTRLASVGDWLADIVGIMLATLVWLMLKKYFVQRAMVLI